MTSDDFIRLRWIFLSLTITLQMELPGLFVQCRLIMSGVHLIKRERKLGLGTAYITGFLFALQKGYRYIVEMDADYSHDPADAAELF